MPLALASAVPVNTDHGAASPQPEMPASVSILTIAPGIDSSMSPTPWRRFILSGQRTTSTESPVMRRSLMGRLAGCESGNFILHGAAYKQAFRGGAPADLDRPDDRPPPT